MKKANYAKKETIIDQVNEKLAEIIDNIPVTTETNHNLCSEEDIEQTTKMVAVMLLNHEIRAIMHGAFIEQTWKTHYKEEIETAKRKGLLPKVEIIVHGNEVMN
jgi:predicted metal-dependent hydrolase